MPILILAYRDEFYRIVKTSPLAIDVLAYFLTTDVASRTEYFIKWFSDPLHELGSSDATQYLVDEGMVIFTPSWKPDYNECIARGNYFQIKFDVLMNLLHQWDTVYKQNPPYITVVVNDDSAKVTGSDILPEHQ